MKYFIYYLQNLLNNKIYIGKTNDPLVRLNRHLIIVKNGKTVGKKTFNLIHKAIVKYSIDNFIFQTIEEFEDEQECLDAEMFWIEYFMTDVNRFGKNYGYNLTAGGEGKSGRKHTEETKKKIGIALQHRWEKLSLQEKNDFVKNLHNGKQKKIFNIGCKINWPDDNELVNMINLSTYNFISDKLGVSAPAISARIKRRNLSHLITEKRGQNMKK